MQIYQKVETIMRISISCLILILFFSSTFISSQNPEWIQYNRCEHVITLIEEGDYIWAGSITGLFKINKATEKSICYNSVNSELQCNNIRALALDSSGNIWVGTYGLFKISNTKWTLYNTNNSPLPINGISAIAVDLNGDIWLGVGDALICLADTIWRIYDFNNSQLPGYVSSIKIDSKGNKWIGTWPSTVTDGGIAKFDGVNWDVYNAMNSGLPDNVVYHVAIDGKDNIWMVTDIMAGDGNLSRFDNENWITYDTSNSGLNCNYVSTISTDKYGKIWIGLEMVNDLGMRIK